MRMTPPAKPGELFFWGGAVSRDTSSGAVGHLPLKGKAGGFRACGRGGRTESSAPIDGRRGWLWAKGNFQNVEKCEKFVTGNGGFRGKC